jgi:hypothetical protein
MREKVLQQMTCKYSFNLDTVKSEKIKRKNYYTDATTYIILNYEKNYMSFDDVNTGLYRSIIFSYPEKRVVCFSPPKSIPLTVFMNKYPYITDNIFINEAVEGVAINLFFDYTSMKWNIATKNSIGGKYWFYGKKNSENSTQYTFLEMFMDALREEHTKELNESVILEYLPKNYCYNFILQHTSNSILLPIESPNLFLIGVYCIDSTNVEYIPPVEYEYWSIFRQLTGIIQFPKKYTVSKYADLLHTNMVKGYMITNIETGERSKIVNKRYENLKSLLLISPSIQYQFLCLYRIGRDKVDEYLTIFPRLKKEFYLLRTLYDEFVRDIHKSYLSKYVYKYDTPILEKYQSHIYKIHHKLYLPILNKHTITKIRYKNVVEYFSKMDPRELLYLLNWDCRNL